MRRYHWFWTLFWISTSYAQWQEGVGTHFQALGSPYGGCGVPDDVLAKQGASAYVALNAFHALGDYRPAGSFGKRPLRIDTLWRGLYEDGKNCGRRVDCCHNGSRHGTNVDFAPTTRLA